MRNKNYIRHFIYHFSLFTLPVILVFSIFLTYFVRDLKKSIQTETQNALYTIRDNYNLVLETATYQYNILTTNPRLSLALRKLINHHEFSYVEVVLTNSVLSNFISLTNNSHYIDSVYYYIDGNDTYLSSIDGLATLSNATDTNWLESYTTSGDKASWIESRDIQRHSYTEAQKMVTLYQKLSMFNGVLLININPKKFESTLTYQSYLNAGHLYVVNSQGDLLFQSSNSETFYNTYKTELLNLLPTSSETNHDFQSNTITLDAPYLVSALSSDYDTYVISCLDQRIAFKKTENYILLFTLLLLVLLLANLYFSYKVTSKNFKQLNYLIDILSNAEKGIYINSKPNFIKDEYDMVLNNIIQLFLNTTFLENQLALKEKQQKLAEFTALQLQINPHFLFNTLQTLNFKALEAFHKPTELNEMIEGLSDILKYSLQLPNTMVTLQEEINYLKKYDTIQHYRYENKYILYYECDETLSQHPFMRLLLQPLIENSLYHGIKPLTGNGYIKLKILKYHDYIRVSVIDSGIGMTRIQVQTILNHINDESSKNIGLTNVNKRLIFQYGEESKLHIQSKLHMGTCISFKIPV